THFRSRAEHDPVVEVHALAHVARPRDDTAPGADSRGDVHVVVDDAAFDHAVLTDADVGAHHAVAVQLNTRADPAVVTDEAGAEDAGRGMDLGARAQP